VTVIPELVYITINLSYVSATKYSLNRLNLWLFFCCLSHFRSADCKKTTRL